MQWYKILKNFVYKEKSYRELKTKLDNILSEWNILNFNF